MFDKSHSEEDQMEPRVALGLPWWTRLLLSLIPLGLAISCIVYGVYYLADPSSLATPAELGLDNIFLFSIACALVILTPWARLGLQPTKIAGIEFRQIVAGQASEHAESMGYLETRIERMEDKVRSLDETAALTEFFEEDDLKRLLLDFLRDHSPTAFSPSKIQSECENQATYSKLVTHDTRFIRSTLQKMVSEGLLATAVSRRGNTLFRYVTQ